MGILDSISKLFGSGKIKIDGETIDGRSFTIKRSYIGSIGSRSEQDILKETANDIWIENDVRVRKLKISGISGTSDEEPNWTYNWFYFDGKV